MAVGIYQVLVINLENVCMAIQSYIVMMDILLFVASIVQLDILNCVVSSVFFIGNGLDLGNGFSLSWSMNDG